MSMWPFVERQQLLEKLSGGGLLRHDSLRGEWPAVDKKSEERCVI